VKRLPFFLLAAALVSLGACGSPKETAIRLSDENDGASSLASSAWVERFTESQDVYRSEFSVSAEGKKAVPAFLQSVGLTFLATHSDLGGNEEVTPKQCEDLFSLYNLKAAQKLSVERCANNLTQDGQHFLPYGIPLAINLKEFDGKYLLLMIEEEGLGGSPLFRYAYDIQLGRLHPLDLAVVGPVGDLFYRGGMLFFAAPRISEEKEIIAAYDFRSRMLTKTKP
jgi:hypothetical protein